ncbi:hypothetical protein ADUPG1_002891, partial [Aduncisulcus paluster]
MDDYRQRYHKVRDAVVESIRAVHPLIPVRIEQTPEGEVRMRPDIVVDVASPVYIEITITYEDAEHGQLQKVTRDKKAKYGFLSEVIVMAFGHSGIYLP